MKSENNWESSWNDTSEWKMNDSAGKFLRESEFVHSKID